MEALLATQLHCPPTHDLTMKVGGWTFGIEETHVGPLFDDPILSANVEILCPPTTIYVGPQYFTTRLSAPTTATIVGICVAAVALCVALLVARYTSRFGRHVS